ncbi:MAG: ATP-binding protein [[Eubacterium] siraeum]
MLFLIRKNFAWLVIVTATLIVMLSAYIYNVISSKLIFKESTTHLNEIYTQVGNSLSNLLSENWNTMDMWIPYLEDTDDDKKIRTYIENIRRIGAFTDFYFLDKDGSYCTVDGNTGRMDLGRNMRILMEEGKNVVSDTALIDRSELIVFAVPCHENKYGDFSYSAIAISFNNDDVISLLSSNTFNNMATNYIVYPNGRVVVNNKGEHGDELSNFWRMLTDSSNNLSQDNIQPYIAEICYNESGVNRLTLDGKEYYLAYHSIGFKDWILIGIVPCSVVNENINRLQTITMSASVSVIALICTLSVLYLIRKNYLNLRKKDSEIKYREELFSVLSNNVDDIFLMLNTEDFSVGYVSPNIERILGISQSEAMSDESIIENSAVTDKNENIRENLIRMSVGERKEWERKYVCRNSGNTCLFHITAFRNKIDGEDRYILAMSDRTKERKTNLALHSAVNEAKKANNAKSSFISGISHDIRTPLSAIIGFASLAANEEGNSEATKEYINKIITSGNQLLGLISDILDISVIESGRLTFNITNVDLSRMFYEIRTVISSIAAEKQHNLTISMHNVTHEIVRCDKHRFEQLIMNFLSNAIKFTHNGGNISLTLTETDDGKNGVPEYEIRVRDNGIGMSEEFTKKIFEPYEREMTDKNIGGTGLGMPISKRIVDAAGGSITVNTKKGAGTEFIIKLQIEAVKGTENRYSGNRCLSALIINNNRSHLAQIAEVLEKLGITYCSYDKQDDGFTADRHFDIIISDADRVNKIAEYIGKNDSDITYIVTTENQSELSLSKYPDAVKGVCLIPLLTFDLKRILSEHCKGFTDDFTDKDSVHCDEPDNSSRTLSGKYILLTEDVEVNVQIVKAMLAKYNVNIEVATNGRMALEMFCRNPDYYYDIILMDLQMPLMDGFQCAKEIRNIRSEYAKTVPIIAMTASAFSEDVNKAKQCGMTGFLTKPVNSDELSRTLTQAVPEENV